MSREPEPGKTYIFDNPRNVQRLMRALYVICALLFVLDFIIHRHTEHPWEWIWGFYPVYGFVGCVVLVLVAKWMRTFLMRSEDYYERNDAKANSSKPLTSDEEDHH